MTDAPSIDDQINEAACIILGNEDWCDRARKGKIKRAPEVIERQYSRLAVQREIMAFLKTQAGARQ